MRVSRAGSSGGGANGCCWMGAGSGMGRVSTGGGRGSCGGDIGGVCRSWPGREGDDSGEGVRGVKGVRGSESEGEEGSGDRGGRGMGSSGLEGSEWGGDEGGFVGIDAWWVGVPSVVASVERVRVGWVDGRLEGVAKRVCWGASFLRFLVRGQGRPSGSSASRCRLSARRARGVSSFSGSEEEESGSMSGSGGCRCNLRVRRGEWAWASLVERRSGQASDTAAAAIIECVGRMEEG